MESPRVEGRFLCVTRTVPLHTDEIQKSGVTQRFSVKGSWLERGGFKASCSSTCRVQILSEDYSLGIIPAPPTSLHSVNTNNQQPPHDLRDELIKDTRLWFCVKKKSLFFQRKDDSKNSLDKKEIMRSRFFGVSFFFFFFLSSFQSVNTRIRPSQ